MSKWLKTLEKMGLIQLEEGDVPTPKPTIEENQVTDIDLDIDLDALSKELDNISPQKIKPEQPPTTKSQQKPSPPPSSQSDGEFFVRDLSEIYADAAIAPSPYPIERMVKLLDGLKAMPSDMRLQAIQAMDKADDSWTIEDSILDGQRKKNAIEKERGRLQQQLEQRNLAIEQEKKLLDKNLEETTKEIREQIAELEAILAEETQATQQQKSQLDAQQQSDALSFQKTEAILQNHLTSIDSVLSSLKQ